MLVKPREKEQPRQRAVKSSKKKCLCSNCHKMQTYKEIPMQIQYGFNCKQSVLIDGIERVCSVCGWHVDDLEVSVINHQLAEKALSEVS